MITARQPVAAHVHLSGDANRHKLLLVQHIDLQIRQRRADHAPLSLCEVCRAQWTIRNMYSGLRDAVHVDQLQTLAAVARVPRFEALELKRFAAENNKA